MTAEVVLEWTPPETWSRPPIKVEIVETGWRSWYEWGKVHHYLTDAKQMPFSTAFTGFDAETGDPVCFVGMSGMAIGPSRRVARMCRLVVMPEWQGAGVGMRFLDTLAEREARGDGFIGRPVPTYFHTAHPALCAALRRSPRWKQVSQALAGRPGSQLTIKHGRYGGHTRSVAGFKFRGVR